MKNFEPTAEIWGSEDAARTVLTNAVMTATRRDIVYIADTVNDGSDGSV